MCIKCVKLVAVGTSDWRRPFSEGECPSVGVCCPQCVCVCVGSFQQSFLMKSLLAFDNNALVLCFS